MDDGSTDDTSERVRKYGSRIEYFYKPNGGQASALNLGFAKARGEIIALLDADDLFLPGKLAYVMEAFQNDPALGMVYHRLLEWDTKSNERREPNSPLISGDIHTVPKIFSFYFPHPTSCVSYRRTSVRSLLPIPNEIRMLADTYLANLIPFLSPILAIPESLALYRIHGANSFYTDEREMSAEARKNRLQKWQTLISAMKKWLAANGYTRKQPPVRAFLNGWTLYERKERLLIKPPGRLRFFWFVVFENYATSPVQTWKLTVFNYLAALSALGFGYQREKQMYEWRGRTMTVLQSLFGRSRSTDSKMKAPDVKA